MARPRTSGRKGWPPNLTVSIKSGNRYYSWIDPRNGCQKSLKATNSFELAATRVKQLNAIIAEQLEQQLLASISSNGKTLGDLCSKYMELMIERGLKENTLRTAKSRLKALNDNLGNLLLESVTPEPFAKLIEQYTLQNKHRMASGIISTAIDMFTEAKAIGWYPLNRDNPASVIRKPVLKVKRSRLTLEQFNTIMDHLDDRDPWRRNICLLALVTGQAREDLSLAQLKKGADWEPMWKKYQTGESRTMPYSYVDFEKGIYYATRQKTGAMIAIPLLLKLDALNITVLDIIKDCMSDKVKTLHLIHHTRNTTLSNPGDPVHKESITRNFAAARDRSKLTWDKGAPTFHEIRSLSERLYRTQGVDTQMLLGHKDKRMTNKYDDARGAEWTQVIV